MPQLPKLTPELIAEITDTVFITPRPEPSDLIFVFGTPQPTVWLVLIWLYHTGFGPKILLTGQTARRYEIDGRPLEQAGIPLEAVLFERTSTTTLDNVKLGLDLIHKQGPAAKRILILTATEHSARCWRTIKPQAPDAHLSLATFPSRYDGLDITPTTWHQHRTSAARVYGEYLRIQQYSARGDIARNV